MVIKLNYLSFHLCVVSHLSMALLPFDPHFVELTVLLKLQNGRIYQTFVVGIVHGNSVSLGVQIPSDLGHFAVSLDDILQLKKNSIFRG